MTVLVLAGTSEANALVDALVSRNIDVVASLAGRTASPRTFPCPVRVGGFGGVDGLVAELRDREITALVDATHPFADEMPVHARDAAAIAGVPHLRLVRRPWPTRDGWVDVDDVAAAARAVHGRTLLTLGRQELDAFRDVDAELLVRSVDAPPDGPWRVLLGRGPFDYDDEVALLRAHRIDVLVTRNSGGTTAKLDAAESLGVRVVMIGRPPALDAPTVHDVDAAVDWVVSLA
jgi:precorrin-6A/cobalt-precorrin-6A reductase